MTREDKDQLKAMCTIAWPWVTGFVTSMALIVYVLSPLRMPEAISIASKNYDRDKLVQLIDYELVGSSTSEAMKRNLTEEDNIFTLGLADDMAKNLITPQNTMSLFNGDEVSFIGLSKTNFDFKSLKKTYVDINTYQWEINSKPSDNTYNHYTIIAKRRGFASWQVVKLDFKINTYIPATSVSKTFVTPVPQSFTNAQGNIACKVDSNSVSCAYTSNDTSLLSAYCTQEKCVYNGKDIIQDKFPPFTGSFSVGKINCVASNTTVSCTTNYSSFTIGVGTFFTTGDPESPFNQEN